MPPKGIMVTIRIGGEELLMTVIVGAQDRMVVM